ncbi:sensor histidine kinase [Bacillus kwashiorkori]|uniref:sensor histidine kinase n=1 Tax=Bacillus kwashiorkori TaxID=1522318 RepID=UPI0007866BA3|nr:HAMP domain-containing sensor histidine kinase [Bacillus kwashiorkori]
MKIKYMYQQLFSHIGIIVIAFLTLSLIVSQYVETLVYKNKEEELVSYGKNILQDIDQSLGFNQQLLNNYSAVLSGRNIIFRVFDYEGRIRYPLEEFTYKIQLTEEEFSKIKRGETVSVKVDLKRFDQAVSLVILPYIKGDALIGGVMLTSPISGTAEMLSDFNHYLFYTIVIAFVISFLLSWLSSTIHVRRINQLKKATSMVAKGNYHVTVTESNFDEIGELARDFNLMVNELQRSKEEIENLENRRRQFLADVSHEMRTPLTTISGVIEGLKNDMIPESEKEKGLDLVSKEAKRLIRLVNENLDYEKIRSNQVKLQLEVIELADIFEIVKEQLIVQAEEKNNKIMIELAGEPFVTADYDRIVQILLNICKNSIQFTENGIITLRGETTANETIIEISDTGIGMDPSEVENIWRRFYKADISRRSNPYGEFGLGLSIVKQLVILHHGQIKVESNKGKGTTFIIRLPINNKLEME